MYSLITAIHNITIVYVMAVAPQANNSKLHKVLTIAACNIKVKKMIYSRMRKRMYQAATIIHVRYFESLNVLKVFLWKEEC